MKNKKILFSILIVLFCSFLTGQDKTSEQGNFQDTQKVSVIEILDKRIIPIETLKPKDPFYKEYSSIVEDNYKLLNAGKAPDMIFFKYTCTKEDSVIPLVSRLCLNYDTIASLNGIESSTDELTGKTLILPTVRGLFIKKNKAENSLEILLKENFLNENLTNDYLCYKIGGEEFYFLPNKVFSPTIRAYFLASGLRLPLDKETFWISSDFGRRKNPFSGEWKNHNGIDLAARAGTPVYAIKDGAVSVVVNGDSTFGNYIILSHDTGKMTSVYAHLSKITVDQYTYVKKGQIIGYVGQSGLATGPHLHFEIRQGGVPQDPQKKLKL